MCLTIHPKLYICLPARHLSSRRSGPLRSLAPCTCNSSPCSRSLLSPLRPPHQPPDRGRSTARMPVIHLGTSLQDCPHTHHAPATEPPRMIPVAMLSILLASARCATVVARPATSLLHVDAAAADPAAALPLRRLHADTREVSVRVADFTALPKDLSGVISIPDVELSGSVTAGAGGSIGPGQAQQLSNVIKAEMVRCCHCSARLLA